MDIKERMANGYLYLSDDSDLLTEQAEYLELLYDYNHTRPKEAEKRAEILTKLFAEVGEDCYIEPPLHANWGCHTHLGNAVYANFNLTLVDDADIYIGDHVMLAPNVVIATAGHPIEPNLRKKAAQFNIPVHIENNVWIGAGAVILPGVTIGENSVIGAGSVVTKDVPKNSVAYGNPCRVVREINEHDREYYYKNRKIDME